MSTSTGFVIGVGAVVVAIGVGFVGGYMLTKTDQSEKIGPSYALGGSSGPSPSGQDAVQNSAPSMIRPVEASMVGISSSEAKAGPPSIYPVGEAEAPETPIAEGVKDPKEQKEKAASSQSRKRTTLRRQKQRQVHQRAGEALPDMEEIKQAIEADIRRRKTTGASASSLP